MLANHTLFDSGGQNEDLQSIPPHPIRAGNRELRSWCTLSELLEDPQLTAPATFVANRVAWRGRMTLLFAREKTGKSTFASAMIGSVSNGTPFLGLPTVQGPVLYAIEEHPGDVAQRLNEFGANPTQVCILDMLAVTDPVKELDHAARDIRPVLIVVDTLSKLAQIRAIKSGDSAEWNRLLSQLTRTCREHDAALVISHHASKGNSGDYRDSTAIGASADMILAMDKDRRPNTRTFKVSGRLRVRDFAVMLHEEEGVPCEPFYSLVEGEPSRPERILAFLREQPGASFTEIKLKIRGRHQDIAADIRQLADAGAIVNRSTGRADAWYIVEEDKGKNSQVDAEHSDECGSVVHSAEATVDARTAEAMTWLRQQLMEQPRPRKEMERLASEAGIHKLRLYAARRALNVQSEGLDKDWYLPANAEDAS